MQPVLNKEPGGTLFGEMSFPEQANHYGTLFGGTALSLMGKAAFVAASRRARRAVVMATSDKIEFHMPVAVGQLVELAAHVARVGRTAMTVDVDVVVEPLPTGERRPALRGQFETVAVDEDGRTAQPDTDTHKTQEHED